MTKPKKKKDAIQVQADRTWRIDTEQVREWAGIPPEQHIQCFGQPDGSHSGPPYLIIETIQMEEPHD